MRFFDSHNHLQDERFAGRQAELVETCRGSGVARMVVNGSCEADWPGVAGLARAHADLVIPAFGCHPWYLQERTAAWEDVLSLWLDTVPQAVVGEIGLDRWKPGLPYTDQEEVFAAQMTLSSERNVPASIHCLEAWGRLAGLLKATARPACGFLLHSYGGPKELVAPLADLGAYFGFPGYFLHERKARQRETFRHVPRDRLLIETDAPDQNLPAALESHALRAPDTGFPINHPANLPAVYQGLAAVLATPLETLADQVQRNFERLFGA